MWRSLVPALRGAWLAWSLLAMVACCATGEVLSVSLQPRDMTLLEGRTARLDVRVETTGEARRTVSWSVSDPHVARVLHGKLTYLASVEGLNAGVTQITATSFVDRSKSDTITVTVLPAVAVTGLAIEQDDAVLVVGAEVQLTVVVSTIGGASQDVVWSSDDPGVAVVGEASGMLTTMGEGVAVITAVSAFDSSFSDSITITVTSSEPGVGTVTVTAASSGSYVSISNPLLGAPAFASGTRTLGFDVAWSESWRGPDRPTWVDASDNWDAVWVFAKHRLDGGAWRHMRLRPGGGSSPGGAVIRVPDDGRGVFVHRGAPGYGDFQAEDVRVTWDYWADGAAVGADVDVRLFAVEMVLVPEGPYSLGSGGSSSGEFRAGGTANTPFAVSRPGPIGLGEAPGQLSWNRNSWSHREPTGSTSASFPTGYAGFYVMKHQLTQGQYVDFLNTLTLAQATERLHTGSADRYGITGDSLGEYVTSLPYVAMNYLSWADGVAFADWAGLRPMTELEFEKAARGPLPPVPHELAWGSTNAWRATGLANAGTIEEAPTPEGANATYWSRTFGNPIGGPLRVGAFAAPGLSREQAGAGYYGALELSGNLWERTVTVGDDPGRAFSGAHGDGALDAGGDATVPCWPRWGTSGAGQRGGSWRSEVAGMRVAQRGSASFIHTDRGPSAGWRGARSAP